MAEAKNTHVEISGVIRHETEKAFLFVDGKNEVWIPKSQVDMVNSSIPDGILCVAEWLAKKNGLI